MLFRLIILAICINSISLLSQSKTRLSDNINRFQPAIAPVMNYEGDELFIDRKFHIDNFGGSKDKDDIWRSRKVGKFWALPQRLNGSFNNEYENVLFNILPDSKTILYYNGANHNKYSIARIEKDSLKIEDIIQLEDYNNSSKNFYGFLSHDGKTLILALSNAESYGDLDLYVTNKLSNGKWSKIQNLGASINTNGIETTPFLALDGKTLYFASNKKGGFGGLDIYMSKRTGNDWTSWTKPINLGKNINTIYDDFYFYLDYLGAKGLLVSEDSIAGRAGVYQFDSLPQAYQPDKYITIEGEINSKHFKINEFSSTDNYFYNSEKSIFRFVINSDSLKSLKFSAKGFEDFDLLIPGFNQISILKNNIDLKELKEQTLSIYFENNSFLLSSQYKDTIANFLNLQLSRNISKITVCGYANDKGEIGDNFQLSKNRALAVKKELQKIFKKNIKFEILPKGQISDNISENPLNRRVDIIIEQNHEN